MLFQVLSIDIRMVSLEILHRLSGCYLKHEIKFNYNLAVIILFYFTSVSLAALFIFTVRSGRM